MLPSDPYERALLLTLLILLGAYLLASFAGWLARDRSDVLPRPSRDAMRGKVGTDWNTVTRNPE